MSIHTTLPITEEEISKSIGHPIKSPILVSSLKHLGLNQEDFLQNYTSFFEELAWDPYDVRRMQVEFLLARFLKDKKTLLKFYKSYYTGEFELEVYKPWIEKLSKEEFKQFKAIQPWRRRSIASFLLKNASSEIKIKRAKAQQFEQDLGENDVRSWPRVFMEAPSKHVENPLFFSFLKELFLKVNVVHPIPVTEVKITAHFMSVKATKEAPGDNSPEGAHEDGADYIVSALVINRKNLAGGESQIIEQNMTTGNKDTIFSHILQPGEFIFQADSRDEDYFGTDLWHHVTPFYVADDQQGEGWRDIIGLDIDVSL